jgi:hypothetical protein
MRSFLNLLAPLLVFVLPAAAADPATAGPSVDAAASIDPADLPPELRGILLLGTERRFTLATPGGTQSGWASIGETFNDWELVEYRDEPQILLLRKEGLEVEVPLATSEIIADEATRLATQKQAEALIRQMDFERMFSRMIEQQKQSTAAMMKQMIPKEAAAEVDLAALTAFQQKVVDVMWSEMNPEQMGADLAKAYAEVFTPAELQGMAEFYGTAAGRAAIEKQPEIQQRLMQSMMPRILAAMPKIQQMGQEFKAEQHAKRAAAAASAAGEPAHPAAAAP